MRNPALLVLLAVAVGSVACSASNGGDDGNVGFEAESVRCAGGATVEGIDVSEWDGHVSWSEVKASGKHFAFARISDGTYHDKTFDTNWPAMKSAGVIRGSYQFFRPNDDPNTLADIVIAKVGKLGNGDLPVVADMEVTDGVGGATIAARLRTWIARVKAGTGKTPIVYTGKYFWRDDVGSHDFAGNALWIAQYGPVCPDLPAPWTNWKFFQYSDKGHVSGISGDVDLDKFNGTLAELEKFAGGDGGGGSPAPSGECYSHTLDREVALNACVQSKFDRRWYQCAGPNDWVIRWNDPTACSSVHPL